MVSCLEAPEGEWPAALEAAAEAHPELADELRARVSALLHCDSPRSSPPGLLQLPDLIDDFEPREPLGSGGMGLVYRAHQRTLDRDVALKLIRPERMLYDGAVARFQLEVETVARLRHRGIVAIHTVGAADVSGVTLPFFAMELLDGASLAEVLHALRGRAPESLAARDLFQAIGGNGSTPDSLGVNWVEACARVALQVASALEYAHAKGILHRDVKPSNIALEPDGRAVLFDFGLTVTKDRHEARVTFSGDTVGTPIYMAPELAESEAGERSDVYALGVTLYELLALQPPFAGDSAAEVARAARDGAADPVRARNRRVPRDLAVVVETAMAFAPADRYASMQALREDLERFIDRRPIAAKPPGPLRRAGRWVERHPARATAVGLGVVLVVGVPAFFLWQAKTHAAELAELVKEERTAKEDAREAAAELEDVVAFTLGMFERANPEVHGGDVPDAREMLHLGAAEIDALSDRPRSRARVEFTLAKLFGSLAEPTAAAPHLERAVAYYEGRSDRASRERLAEALRQSAHAAFFLRELDEASAHIDRALGIALELHPEPSPELVAHFATLAEVLGARGELDGAVEARRRALAQVAALDAEDPSRMRSLVLLGVALKERGDLEAARPLLEEALAWAVAQPERAPGLGSERELALLVLGDIEKLEGNLEAALERAREARARLVATRGEDNLLTQQAAMGEAEILARLGRYDEALPEFESLSAALARRLPARHPVVLRTRLMQLACLDGLGRQPEVAPLCVEHDLAAAFEEVHGASHPNTIRVLRARAISHQTRNEGPAALEWLAKLESAQRNLAEWSGDHADAIFMLVALRMAQGGLELEASRTLLEQLLTAVEGTGLQAVAAIGGRTYDVEKTARQFLTGLPR